MYRNKSFDEKLTSGKRSDDYDLCNTETGQKFVIKWSSQDGARYLSKNRYASPRSVSKSVPRRNRGVVRYNINRSLNFDIGSQRGESYASPNSSTDSNASHDGDQYLSRSAKILRALNINYSPLQSAKLAARKINKSLNFDLSPSPKRLANFSRSPRNPSPRDNFVSPISKINKTLNFDTSSSESNINSVLSSSVESIDENQNQTPSQRNRSAKKSLSYLTPSSEKSFGSPVSNVHSPMLRSGLKEKIDNIVRSNATPSSQSIKRNQMKSRFDDFGASTPRNLFNDFHEDDDDEEREERPQTPENVIKIIPESMSAIKKSHRKERALGRLGKAIAYQVESCLGRESFTDVTSDAPREENRPTTPSTTIARYKSPQRGVNSIKQSHKKDKSKRKPFAYRSEDEMSESGSIFDYTDEANIHSEANPLSPGDEPNLEKSKRRDSHVCVKDKERALEENCSPDDKLTKETPNKSLDDEAPVPSRCGSCPDYLRDADQGPSAKIDESPSTGSNENPTTKTPERVKSRSSLRPVTPENRVNYLQRVMTDSIKKSHKKIKDINRRSIFKPKLNQANVEVERTLEREENEDRAATPENTNSSRLLLSQFSSVKKSHSKDKHRRMISGSVQRKKYFNREVGEAASNSDCDLQNCSVSSSASDFPSLSPPRLTSKNAKRQKSESNDCSFSDNNSSDAHYHTFDRSPLKDATSETGVDALPTSDVGRSSPNKRKSLLNVSSNSGVSNSSSNLGSISMEYESAEEEFKIFTPIKKRKSLGIIAPTARRLCENTELSPEEASTENSATRCSTPTTARGKSLKMLENSFKTPERNASGVFVTITDYSSPVLREIDNVADDPSGRCTPQNSSNAELLVGLNSIKKSHKKDKRGNVSKRSLISAQEEEYEFEPIASHEKSSDDHRSSPQPSTSYAHDRENENGSQVKTPPNCLKAKTYLRLLQTASIKKSHKKVRERKKYRSVTVDQDLSDDGSIFDEAEKSMTTENESFKAMGYRKENHPDDDRAVRTSSPEIDVVRISPKKKGRYIGGPTRSRYSGNLSDDGSIFDPEEKLESP